MLQLRFENRLHNGKYEQFNRSVKKLVEFNRNDYKRLQKDEPFLLDGIIIRNKDFSLLKILKHKRFNSYIALQGDIINFLTIENLDGSN